MSQKFQRRPEDFACGHCGFNVIGDGYTNHCPRCLWSRHVDVNPGDRAAVCGGLMEPIAVELVRDDFVLRHRCLKCGAEKTNRSPSADDRSAIIELAKTLADQKSH
jgi:hypothetical protein